MKQICLIEIIHDSNNYCFIVKSFDNFFIYKKQWKFSFQKIHSIFVVSKFLFLIYLVYVMIKQISIYLFQFDLNLIRKIINIL